MKNNKWLLMGGGFVLGCILTSIVFYIFSNTTNSSDSNEHTKVSSQTESFDTEEKENFDNMALSPQLITDASVAEEENDKKIFGIVLNKNGKGIAGADISAIRVKDGHTHLISGKTDPKGAFVLDGAKEGTYRVIADAGKLGRAQVPTANYKKEVKLVIDKRNLTFFPLNNNGESITFPIIDTTQNLNSVYTGGSGTVPISLGSINNKVIITRIKPGSKLAHSGAKKGDRILSVNGKKVFIASDARKALIGKFNSVVMIEIKSKKERFTIITQRTTRPDSL